MLLMMSGGRRGWSHHMERASRLGSFQARKGTVSVHLLQCSNARQSVGYMTAPIHSQHQLCTPFVSFSPSRVEKKERARLKTVKFHARTGMIESNRVSVEDQLLPALVPERLSSELLLGSQGDGLLPP